MENKSQNQVTGQEQKKAGAQVQYQKQEQKKEQSPKMMSRGSSSVKFNFETKAPSGNGGEGKKTVISEALNAAFFTSRSKEYMDILKKQVISGMSDEQIKQIIAREIIRGQAEDMGDVTSLKVFMESGSPDVSGEPISEEEQAMIEEMSEDDVLEFLEMLNASFSETIAKEELKLKEALVELDKKAIDDSYTLALCPISPSHDIHILPKGRRLFFCHLTHKELSPVFKEAKRLLFNKEAAMVHVYQGCAFVVNAQGEVTKRIDVVDEPMELVIRNGWEELP